MRSYSTSTGRITPSEAELAKTRFGIERLRDALEELMVWQNGPPLVTYEEGWTAAMEKAKAALAATAPTAPEGEEAMTTPLSDELDDARWHRHSLAKANVEIAKLRELLRECDLWLGDVDYREDPGLVSLREKIHDALEGRSPPLPRPQPADGDGGPPHGSGDDQA